MKPNPERAAELSAIIARLNPNKPEFQIARAVVALQSIARSQKRAAENLCNVPDYQETYDARTKRNHKKAAAILADILPGARMKLGGDPRGCCAHLYIPGVPGDSWGSDENGQKTWGVY